MSRARLILLCAALCCAVYYFATPSGIFGSKAQGDGYFGFHHLPALLLHHTVDMRPTSPQAAAVFDQAADGRLANRNPLGPALAMLPVYTGTVLIEGAARLLAPRSPQLAGPPYAINIIQTFWTGAVTLAAGLCALALLFRSLRRRFGESAALAGCLAALCCTPLWWYLTTQPHYQHGLAFAAVTLVLCTWERHLGQVARARFLRLGLLCGLAALLRTQEIVLLCVPGGEALVLLGAALRRRDRSGARAALHCGVALGAGALLAFVPQLITWTVLFGVGQRPTTVELLRPGHPALLEVLFSMRSGLLPWTPVVYLALPGLLLLLRRSRGLALGALAFLLADLWLVSSSWVWYGAFGFGCRRLSDCAPLWALGVAAACAWAASLRRGRAPALAALTAFLVLCGAINLTLVEASRRRIVPSAGASARPAYRWVEEAGGPRWLAALLRRGDPFVQPMGWIFALQHRAPATAWEAVVGNYALEREAHDRSITGDTWDLRGAHAADWALDGGRRLLLQPFADEPISGELRGAFPAGPATLRWDGTPLAVSGPAGDVLSFQVPRALVHAHRVAELVLELPPGADVRELRLRSTTRWWRDDALARPPALHLPTR